MLSLISLTADMKLVDVLGTVAGILTSIAMLPQLFKVLKEKKVENLSVIMLVVLIVGVALWVVYGVLKKEWPIILSNAFSVLVNSVLLVCYFLFKKNKTS